MAVIPGTYGIKVGNLGGGQAKTAVGLYDFATQGGAVGAITLSGEQIPASAIITDTLVITDTVPTSGGAATLGVTVEAAGDVVANGTLLTATPWSTTGAKRGAVTATSVPVTTTASRSIAATVGVAALTAGKFRVIVTYIQAP